MSPFEDSEENCYKVTKGLVAELGHAGWHSYSYAHGTLGSAGQSGAGREGGPGTRVSFCPEPPGTSCFGKVPSPIK